jgi:uncharacterized sporulation protein YeaH/YhbH (DUF444 family)
MSRKSKANLESASAEAAWYTTPEGRRQTQREFERALKRGSLLRSPGSAIPQTDAKVLAELVEKAKAKATKAISIRLPVADLERAQQIAAREGVGYQTVLKRAILFGLKKLS